MRIILTQNVANLGFMGDEVSVKDGYARNYLLPRGMAMTASGKNAKALQHRRQFLEKQREEAIEAARSEAEKVAALELVVRARAGTGGRLFGSVTNRDLQALLAEQGYEVDRKAITLHAPARTLGTFGATVRLHTDVKTDIEFRVEPSEVVTPTADEAGETIPGDEAPPAEGAEAPAEVAAAEEGASEAAPAEAAPEETPPAETTAETTAEPASESEPDKPADA